MKVKQGTLYVFSVSEDVHMDQVIYQISSKLGE
jgi:hypothetical protein